MARHRSPQGRRAHLGLPLSAAPAAAGAGGAHRLPALGASAPVRFVATAVAGSALAAAGQMALSSALPAAVDGGNLLRVGVGELLASPATAPPELPTLTAYAPVAFEPQVVGAAELVKAAELDRLAVERAAAEREAARLAEAARVAEEAAAAEAAAASASVEEVSGASVGGAVQMVVGRITSGFGARWGTSHQGLDIAAPIGTPIRVPLDGTVTDSGPAGGFGQWVRVRHDDGTVTVYGHISRSLVSEGDTVEAGEVIAEVGNEGRSTGPHLHFEVHTADGTKINPRPWLDERGVGLT